MTDNDKKYLCDVLDSIQQVCKGYIRGGSQDKPCCDWRCPLSDYKEECILKTSIPINWLINFPEDPEMWKAVRNLGEL
jgi:hypothetical protein